MSKDSRRGRKSQPVSRRRERQSQQSRGRSQRLTTTTTDRSATPPGQSRAAVRREERRRQREEQDQRNKVLRIGGSALAVVLLVAIAWAAYRWWMGPDVSGDVITYFDKNVATAVHPEDDTFILYEQVPPVGGPHNAIWQSCGYYSEPIFNWHGVHALEHGAVWLTYDPELPQEDIDDLADKANQGYVLVSPYPGLDAPVVGSVWGKQIRFTGADDDRIDAFIKQYRLNPDNSPEQGATCSGGVTLTTDQLPQQTPYQRADQNADPIGGLTSIDATATAEAPPATPSEASPSPEGTPAARSDWLVRAAS